MQFHELEVGDCFRAIRHPNILFKGKTVTIDLITGELLDQNFFENRMVTKGVKIPNLLPTILKYDTYTYKQNTTL